LLVEEFKCKRPLKSNSKPFTQVRVEKHVARLEQRYGRVTACRVVLKAPGGHHRAGGLYEVNIHRERPRGQCRAHPAGVPRRSVVCYKRCLQACAPTAAGSLPTVAGTSETARRSTTATVKTIDASGEFGFLEAADDNEVYFAGLVRYADAHWGYGFPIGGVAGFDPGGSCPAVG
jgi:hypothetical protein